MDTERMWKPALIGGLLLGVLSSLPVVHLFNCVCCAWIIGGGLLAAYLYVKDSPFPVTLGSGVAIGLFAGIIGAIVSTLFSIPLNFLIHSSSIGLAEQFRQIIEQVPNIPPETRAALRSFSDRSDLGIIYLLFHLFFTLVLFCLFAMLGGAIGVAVFEKRKPGEPPNNQSSYQPPAPLPPADTPPSETPPADTPQKPPDEQ
jgi:H+/Cl- antiporter ClcA